MAKKETAPVGKKVVDTTTLAHGIGRRKKAVARVWLKRGKGNLVVNDRAFDTYFDTEIAQKIAKSPYDAYPNTSLYDIAVSVDGGGLIAQADAVKLGISRALVLANPEVRSLLRDKGLLTVDSRVKERKKYGQRAARARFQFTKR